ncbi:hypothetical protein G6L33_11170 [Agrobacterium rhizogenes]|nr:hypothetical protein [Rhizobium rhizogenes]NTH64412.1 hypothetical protein [Rhizobium rhizogenes]NTJ32092.1 hypothetical protein [Rhizobium rhizogenes]
MAETANIARMAEKLSDEIFEEFMWRKAGPTNQNWPCEHKEAHGVSQHPTDVVFFYDEPYSEARSYIQCDLKSYAKSSITRASMKSAVLSLAMQVTCAETSERWQQLYADKDVTAAIAGLLFVYNHDDEFDRDFDGLLADIKNEELNLNEESRLFIMGPELINWLNRVASEIKMMRGKAELPDREATYFYYPQLVRTPYVQIVQARSATLEMLTSPWIVLRHDSKKTGRKGVVIFHKRPTSQDGLVYLLDYLRQHELLAPQLEVLIKVPESDKDAPIILQKSVNSYIDNISGSNADSDIAGLLKKIKLDFVPENKSSFSEIQIGMDYAR